MAPCVRCRTTCGSVPVPSLQSRQTDGGREAYQIILQMRS